MSQRTSIELESAQGKKFEAVLSKDIEGNPDVRKLLREVQSLTSVKLNGNCDMFK